MSKLNELVSAIKGMRKKGFTANTRGQLDINLAVAAILGLILASAFLVIGIVVLQGIVDGAGIGVNDTMYNTLDNVTNDIESSMSLAGTMLLVIIGVAILMMLAGVMVIMRMFR